MSPSGKSKKISKEEAKELLALKKVIMDKEIEKVVEPVEELPMDEEPSND